MTNTGRDFTKAERRAGYRAMEESLTPMQKAYRTFLSGKPPEKPKDTPLGAVALATEQRQRLTGILAKEGLKAARVTGMAVVIRFVPTVPDAPADAILVEEGKEGQAISHLTEYGARFKEKKKFVIAGLHFAIQDGKDKRLFTFPIERNAEGHAALMWSHNRQSSVKGMMN
jgi:hypothetical protein